MRLFAYGRLTPEFISEIPKESQIRPHEVGMKDVPGINAGKE
jgi:hypothetical protein